MHLYRTSSDHNHDDANVKSNAVDKIPAAIADEIRSMHTIGMKPKAILFNLVRKGLTPPKKNRMEKILVRKHDHSKILVIFILVIFSVSSQ